MGRLTQAMTHGCVLEWLQGNRVCGRIVGGEVAEWPIAPVLKTGEVRASAGSNPALSAPHASHGLISSMPVSSKSLVFLVARVAA